MSGIIEPKTFRTEQYEFKARTTDPANPEPGGYWIRTDQTSSNPDVVAELRRQDTNGVSKIPLFDASEEANLGSQMVRGPSVVLDDGTVGFVAMTSDSRATFGSPRVVTAAGTEYLSDNSLTLSTIPVPNSAVEQFTAKGYDTGSDEWIGQLGNHNLTGGTATKTTDSHGNTVIRYDPATSASHANSNLSLSSPQYVVSIVFNNWVSDTMIVGGASGEEPYWRKVSSSNYSIKTGSNGTTGGSPDGNIGHALFFGPDSSGEPKLEIDGTVVIPRFNSGDSGISGFRIGNRGSQDFLYDGDVLEVVPMQDPTSQELSDERSRVQNKYNGLTF